MNRSKNSQPHSKRQILNRLMNNSEVTVTLFIVIAAVIVGISSGIFFTRTNLVNISKQVAVNGIISMGMMLAIIAKGVDLSVGSTLALVCVIAGSLIQRNVPVALVLVSCLATGAVCGFINGILIVKLNVMPIIVTLGIMNIYRGIAYVYSGGKWTTNLPSAYIAFGNGLIPASILILIVIIFSVVMKHTCFGRHVYAMGSNEESARLAGINVDEMKVKIFTIVGLLTGVAAIVFIGRVGAIQPSAGDGYEMDAIGAAVLGGVSFSGGKGTPVGTLLGAVLMGLIMNAMTLMKIGANWQGFATGVIIIMALLLDTVRTVYRSRRAE